MRHQEVALQRFQLLIVDPHILQIAKTGIDPIKRCILGAHFLIKVFSAPPDQFHGFIRNDDGRPLFYEMTDLFKTGFLLTDYKWLLAHENMPRAAL